MEGSFFPMEIGNYWVYDVLNSRGEVVDTARIDISDRWSILDGIGPHRYGWENRPATVIRDVDHVDLYYEDSRGLIQAGYMSNVDTIIVENVLYPFPTLVGAKTVKHVFGYVDNELRIMFSMPVEVVAMNEHVVTPLGDFQAIRYRTISPLHPSGAGNLIVDRYISPGIGVVAIERRDVPSPDLIKDSMYLSGICLMHEVEKISD